VARRVNAKWTTVVPGRHDVGLEWDYQTANVIDNLKRLAGILEPAAWSWSSSPQRLEGPPGALPHEDPQAFQICRAVGSPSCKILFDMYHQQITEGNIIPNIDRAWSEVAYFQIGDNPAARSRPPRDELPEHLRPHPRPRLPGLSAWSTGSRSRGSRARRRSSRLPVLRRVLTPDPREARVDLSHGRLCRREPSCGKDVALARVRAWPR